MSEPLLNNQRYGKIISETKNIAIADYELIQKEIEPSIEILQDLQKFFKEKQNKINKSRASLKKNEAEKATLSQTSENYSFLIEERLADVEKLKSILEAKKRSIGKFTVAIMGRTKAGKSTLFATLLGQFYEGIGSGQQRTTRKNKVYDIGNGIHLIDTPGIGAVNGGVDEEEALKAVDESDLICYIVTSDGIHQTEFDFLGKLKNKTKPILILLNVQYNLKDEKRLPIFFRKSQEMLRGVDSQQHQARILEYAKNYYNNDSIMILPVMLLASQLSRQKDDKEIAKKLYDASGLQAFIDYVENIIEKQGKLLISHNLLGETSVFLTGLLTGIKQELQSCENNIKVLYLSKEEIYKKTLSAKQDCQLQLETEIKELFQKINKRVPEFAKQHWNSSPEAQEQEWNNLLKKQIKFGQSMENIFENIQFIYKNRIEEALEEVAKDIQFMCSLNNEHFNFLGVDGGIDFRFLLNIGSILLTMGSVIAFFAFPPLVFLAIPAGVLGLVKNFFKSKKERQKEISQKIEQNLTKTIKKSQEEIIKKANISFEKACNKVEKSLNKYFEDLINEINIIKNKLLTAKNALNDLRNNLAGFFGLRIFNWCSNSDLVVEKLELGKTIKRLRRKPGQYFYIYLRSSPIPSQNKQKECSKILVEQVSFYFD